MTEARIIKKYQNRCLYDTSVSKYISLADLKQLVFDAQPFEVREVKTEKDITRQVLLQIISEEESGGTPLFTTDVLMRFIRMYGDSVEDTFSSYMEQSLSFFDQQAKQFMGQLEENVELNPLSVWTDITKKNLAYWSEAQKSLIKTAGQKIKPDSSS